MAEAAHHWTDPNKRGSGSNLSSDDLFSLVGDDVEIRRRVKLLVNMLLEDAFNILFHGSVEARTQLSRAMMPSIVKMMASKDDGGLSALRAEMMEQFEQMRNPMIGYDDPPLASDATADTAVDQP